MLCQVCGKHESKYTCPACQIRSCSLECVKRHKAEKGCSGIKPKTTYVPLDKMDSNMLMKDCALLDEVRSAVIHANDKFHKTKKPQWQKILEKQCQERGITIRFMPKEMTRSKENNTRCRSKLNQTIYWTCRFRFRNENKDIVYERLVNDIVETSILQDIFNGIVETTPNDFVAKANLDEFEILLLAEGASGGGHYQVETSISLSDNLFSKTIIEYPIFDVVPKENLSDWNIVSVFDVRNIDELKEKPNSNPKKAEDLPSYETIKEALKLDIITGVLKSSKLSEEQNAPLPPVYDSNIKNNTDQI
ncbi:Box C/D snoRNA protein 1 [Tritrichomonas musculus]|uniref:Box C/D snoRNA protein 1 n=1 Tax=Tritrichomonas musculus TaxID=1915356 RepID=A0ABR2IB59_9EUKA